MLKQLLLLFLYFSVNSSFLLRQLLKTVGKLNNKNEYPKLNINDLSEQDKYDLQWYVVGSSGDFISNKPNKITIWSKNYVVWKNSEGVYSCLDDICSHKGASLSCGKIHDNCVVCPYHGYEFNGNGTLMKVPGLNFQSSPVYDVSKYSIVEKNGWIYLNTIETNATNPEMDVNIFQEEEFAKNFSVVHLDMEFDCYSRILSENSLDIMHIGFVHTFGNRERPSPIQETPPTLVSPFHYKSTYEYESGKDSIVKKMFDINTLKIENEFILPHTTVARIIFGNYVNTVVTFALPISDDKSRLFVKTYRNFWNNDIGNVIMRNLMYNTMLQDKIVVENIDMKYMDGKFNMKFDKLQNTYKSFYKKLVHNFTDIVK
jgi:phenylpropionate dioxygenase-like ring-hydroxylating dioxygenase large terminal subunit